MAVPSGVAVHVTPCAWGASCAAARGAGGPNVRRCGPTGAPLFPSRPSTVRSGGGASVGCSTLTTSCPATLMSSGVMSLRNGSSKSIMIHERSAISLPPFMNSRSYAMPVHACVDFGSVSSTVKRCGCWPSTSSVPSLTVAFPARSRAVISMK